MEKLESVYAASTKADITEFTKFIELISHKPLTAIGSGGSLSTAAFTATLHEHFCNQVSRASTPLDVLSNIHTKGANICFSASGRNRDIGAAFKALCIAESGPVGALVMADNTPLHLIAKKFSLARICTISDSTFQDGFLAVATMIASAVIILRAYESITGAETCVPESLNMLANSTIDKKNFGQVIQSFNDSMNAETISLIYTDATRPAAIDLESRFVEAALGNLHIADLRNFGHGRHHWMAKRGDRTAVVALIGSDWEKLSIRTLDHLPGYIPKHYTRFSGPFAHQALSAMIVGLFISYAAGKFAGIDPGKPGVPEFGRRLYRLGPGPLRFKQSVANRNAALKRKLPKSSDTERLSTDWNEDYDKVIKRLATTEFIGVALDFDGTLCEVENRFDPISSEMALTLNVLLQSGIKLGISTGRGPSAGERLREVLPKKYWDEIVIGYYNAGCITQLSNQQDPIQEDTISDRFSKAISQNGCIDIQKIRSNSTQISIHLAGDEDVAYATSIIGTIARDFHSEISIVTSGHSIDVLRIGQCKTHVISEMKKILGSSSGEILRIGDQGSWPGNDARFLNSPFGLSVNKVSQHRRNCWNLAPAGVQGVQATNYYINALIRNPGNRRLIIKPGDKGEPREA